MLASRPGKVAKACDLAVREKFGRLGQEALAIIPWGANKCKEGLIVRLFENLFLQAKESAAPLAVEKRHVDTKQSQKGIGSVLRSCCFSPRHPRHSLSKDECVQQRERVLSPKTSSTYFRVIIVARCVSTPPAAVGLRFLVPPQKRLGRFVTPLMASSCEAESSWREVMRFQDAS